MRCDNCDAENRPRLKFCTQCGSHMTAGCPQCGSETLPEDAFCGDCGAVLALASTSLLSVAGRRVHTRLPPMFEAELGGDLPSIGPVLTLERLEDDDQWAWVDCALIDVSQGGIGVVADWPIPVGGRVRARLEIGGRAHEAEGVVVFSQPVSMEGAVAGHRCGIAFDGLQPVFVSALAGVTSGTGFLATLGDVALDHGDHAAAKAWFEESLSISMGLDDQTRVPRLLESFAALASAQGDHGRALRLAGAAASARAAVGTQPTPARQAIIDRWLDRSREALPQPEEDAEWEAGQKMGLGEAISYAMGDDLLSGAGISLPDQ